MRFMKITRLLPVVLSFIGALALGTVPVASADSVTFKVPKGQKSGGWADPAYDGMKEAIEKGTEGRVLIQYFEPNQLVGSGQMLEALRAGISDIGYVIPGYYPTEFPLSQGFNLPYKWPDGVTGNRLWNALYDKYMNIDIFQMGIDMCGAYPAAGYDLFTIDKPITKTGPNFVWWIIEHGILRSTSGYESRPGMVRIGRLRGRRICSCGGVLCGRRQPGWPVGRAGTLGR